MIVDKIENLYKYAGICEGIDYVLDYLRCHSLDSLPEGKTVLHEDSAWVNVETCQPRTKAEARLEVHRLMMDIQIPLDGQELHGCRPLSTDEVSAAEYSAKADISFLNISPQNYFQVFPGQFVIYLPGEGHAPAITDVPLRKAVFKIKYQTPYNHA